MIRESLLFCGLLLPTSTVIGMHVLADEKYQRVSVTSQNSWPLHLEAQTELGGLQEADRAGGGEDEGGGEAVAGGDQS